MSNSIGTIFRVTIFGQSHAPAIGVTMEGLPAGIAIDMEALQAFLDRRAPGRDPFSTPRKEADRPVILSGLKDGVTCGGPVTAVIYNENTRSRDYEDLRDIPRPAHADLAAMKKFGDSRDYAGGGQFSGRLTAPLCIAGGICLQILARMGVTVSARAQRIGGETDMDAMKKRIEEAKQQGDSVGGVISCCVDGLKPGIGEPMFDGMENRIAAILFGIPAVKGVEFGDGFAVAQRRGSENNDPFTVENGQVITTNNHCGGILGGITNGMPLVVRAAFKPTPSIAKEQQSVDLNTMTDTTLTVHGRHDPCIVPRAVPCVEAAVAIAVYDAWLEATKYKE